MPPGAVWVSEEAGGGSGTDGSSALWRGVFFFDP